MHHRTLKPIPFWPDAGQPRPAHRAAAGLCASPFLLALAACNRSGRGDGY